jgi:hypothetical protein
LSLEWIFPRRTGPRVHPRRRCDFRSQSAKVERERKAPDPEEVHSEYGKYDSSGTSTRPAGQRSSCTVSAVSSCLEIFLGRKIPISLDCLLVKSSPKDGEKMWSYVVDTILPLCIHLDEAISDGLKSAERVKKSIQKFQSLVEVTAASNRSIYSTFAQKVVGK